ncbi:MAG: hypothetical protein KA447_15120 [Pyrinomonadaceae bacterium]|nr:hypothetical protein [Pyrinomonadaceae bacterium]
MRYSILVLIFTICVIGLTVKAQSRPETNWRDVEPKTVTLYSRIKYIDEYKGYGKSAFSFKNDVRSDVGQKITGNNYELQYGSINLDHDSDWFKVSMGTDDCSRIKDLGELNWSGIFDVPYLPASPEPRHGVRMPSKTETFEESSGGQVTKVVVGHIYVVHSKDSDSDFYTLFRVDKLVPSDEVTISWKVVPSPEK